MRFLPFSARNGKELLREPLTLVFGIGFPVVLLLMISFMKQGIRDMPADVFPIDTFAPGMAVFGLSFLALFLGQLISNDRRSSFLLRLFASPLTGFDFIAGYTLPVVPVAVAQSIVCFAVALCLGMTLSVRLLPALLLLIPAALLFISMGLLMGTYLNNSQVGGIGSIIINVAAWLSGTWFSLDLIGGAFKTICELLPFSHAVNMVEGAIRGDFSTLAADLIWVLGYTAVMDVFAVWSFQKKMKG